MKFQMIGICHARNMTNTIIFMYFTQDDETEPVKKKMIEESQTNPTAQPSGSTGNKKSNNFQQMAEEELLKLRQALRERQKAAMV